MGDKGFYQSYLRNEVDFANIMNVSPNILSKNQNFKKLRHGFVDKWTMSTTTNLTEIIISQSYQACKSCCIFF